MFFNMTLVNHNWLWIDPPLGLQSLYSYDNFPLFFIDKQKRFRVNARVSTKMTETGAQQTCRPSLTMRPRLLPFCPVASFANK